MRSHERAERVQKRLEMPLIVAALLVVPATILINSDGSEGLRALGGALNWLSWLAFAVELVAMLVVVPDPRSWAREHPLRVVIVIATVPLLPAALGWLRLLRLFRLLALLRLLPGIRSAVKGGGIRYPALLALFVVVLGGLALPLVEPRQNLGAGDGMWWSMQTVTTVGYGDIVPRTDAGRLLGVLVMVTGIALVGYVTASGADRLVTNAQEAPEPADDVAREIADRLDLLGGQLDTIGEQMEAIEHRLDAGDDRPGRGPPSPPGTHSS